MPGDFQSRCVYQFRHTRDETRSFQLRVLPGSGVGRTSTSLHGACAGLCEIRFEFKNVAYRPLGFFSGRMEFTIVVIATKKGSTFDPRNACELGLRRMAMVMADRRKAHECDVE